MNQRGRRWAVFLPVFVTLALAAVVGTAIIIQNQAQSARVAEADRAGEIFLSDVGNFRASVVDAINHSDQGDPGELIKVLDTAVSKPPVLEEAPADGIDRSATYAEARETQRVLLKPYRTLRRELRRADIALDFIGACRDVLTLRASDYVGFGLLRSSQPIRTRMIPVFVRARDDFRNVRVPQGQDELAGTVRAALQYVIDEATVLADKIDAHGTYYFSYAENFRTVAVEVEDFAIRVKGDVVEALNALNEPA